MDPSYRIRHVDTLETPALVFYEEKIQAEHRPDRRSCLGGYRSLAAAHQDP